MPAPVRGNGAGPPTDAPGCSRETLERASRPSAEVFSCQAKEQMRFTAPLSPWDVLQYVRDFRSGSVSWRCLVRGLAIAMFNRIQRYRGGRRYPDVHGTLTKTPKATLDLKPGELVQVKSKAEILATLDVR